MRLTTISIIIFCLSTFMVLGQKNNDQRTNNVLRGKILYLNSGKQPAIGVGIEGSISSIDYANKTYSTNDGSYELIFPNNKDGYKVELEIDKTDGKSKEIEVVNTTEVEDCYIRAEVTNGFEIIVCPKGARDTVAQRYYNIIKTSSDFALEAKKKELDQLYQAQQKDWEEITAMTQKISQLEKQTDSLAIYRTAWRIASVNKDKANERVLKYIDALDKGKTIQEALKILSIELASKQVDKGMNIIDEAIEELELCAEASMTVFDYNSAIACYDTIIFKMEKMDKNPLVIAEYYNDAFEAAYFGGKYKKALNDGKKAINIRESILDPKHHSLAATYNNIGNIYQYLGQYEKTLEFQQKAIKIFKETLDSKHPDLATSYNNIAVTNLYLGQFEKALKFQQKSIEIQGAILDPQHPSLANSNNNMATIYQYLGQYDKALKFHQKAIEIQEAILDPKNPLLAIYYTNIGNTYKSLGQYEKALEFQQKSIEIQEEILDPKHPLLAAFYNSIGLTYESLGQYKKALEFQQNAIHIRETILDSKHPDLAQSYNSISVTYLSSRQYEKALEFQKKAIKIRESILDPKHPSLATSYNNIGKIYDSIKQYEKALEFLIKSIAILEETLDPKHPNLAHSYNNIAQIYKSLEQFEKALAYQQKAIQIAKEALPENHPKQKLYFDGLIKIYHSKGKSNFEKKDYTNALEDFQTLNEYQVSDSTLNSIGLCHYHLKNYTKAIEAYQNAALLDSSIKAKHFYNKLGTAYAKNKQFKKAFEAFTEYEKLFPNEGRPFRNWAMYYALQNDTNKALTHLQKAIDLDFDDLEWLKTDNSMDSLRNDPAFIELLKKLEKSNAETQKNK